MFRCLADGGSRRDYVVERFLIITLVVALSPLAMSRGMLAQPTTESTYEAVEVTDVRWPGVGRATLSPNGTAVLIEHHVNWQSDVPNERAICVLEIPDLAERFCLPWPESDNASGPRSAATWSPDSSRIVLSDTWLIVDFYGELWLIDAISGDVENLTGGRERLSDPPTDVRPDGYWPQYGAVRHEGAPVWSPDGTAIAYIGAAPDEEDWVGTALYRLNLDATGLSTGQPELVAVIDEELPSVVYESLFWTSDGERIVYNRLNAERYEDPSNGIWTVAATGGEPRQIRGWIEDIQNVPWVIQVSPVDDLALVVGAAKPNDRETTPALSLTHLTDGSIELLELATPASIASTIFYPELAGFSPDGRSIVRVQNTIQPHHVSIRDIETGEESVLDLDLDEPISTFGLYDSLEWTENNLIHLPRDNGARGLLVTVADRDPATGATPVVE